MSKRNYEQEAWNNCISSYFDERDAIELAVEDFRIGSVVRVMDTETDTKLQSPCAREVYAEVVGSVVAQVAKEYLLSDNEMNTVIEIARDRVGR